MHALFDALPRVPLQPLDRPLLDTCFLISLAEQRRLHHLTSTRVAPTSFNLDELAHVAHHLSDTTKEELRRFFKHPNMVVVEVPVHPGDRAAEHAFVASVDEGLLAHIPDPSDAVLMAAALRCHADVYTKDKHHLFTTLLENYLCDAGIHVWKEWKDA